MYIVLSNATNLAISPAVKFVTKIVLLQNILDTPIYYLITFLLSLEIIQSHKMLINVKIKKKKISLHSTSLCFLNRLDPKQIDFYLLC